MSERISGARRVVVALLLVLLTACYSWQPTTVSRRITDSIVIFLLRILILILHYESAEIRKGHGVAKAAKACYDPFADWCNHRDEQRLVRALGRRDSDPRQDLRRPTSSTGSVSPGW